MHKIKSKYSTNYSIIKILVSILLFNSTLFISSPSAKAATWLDYQSSPVSASINPNLPSMYDVNRIDFGILGSDPSRYIFFLDFKSQIVADLFSVDIGSYAGIFLDINNDGNSEYMIETSRDVYNDGYYHPGSFMALTDTNAMSSNICDVRTWEVTDTQSSYIAFSIPNICLPFGSSVSIQGFSAQMANGVRQIDYADFVPDNFWTINLPTNSKSSIDINTILPNYYASSNYYKLPPFTSKYFNYNLNLIYSNNTSNNISSYLTAFLNYIDENSIIYTNGLNGYSNAFASAKKRYDSEYNTNLGNLTNIYHKYQNSKSVSSKSKLKEEKQYYAAFKKLTTTRDTKIKAANALVNSYILNLNNNMGLEATRKWVDLLFFAQDNGVDVYLG